MFYLSIASHAVRALFRHKLRSALTVLGICIGIGAVICAVAIGQAASAQVQQQLENLGDNFVWIEAGSRAVNGIRAGSRGTSSLTLQDMDAIKSQVPQLKLISPNVDSHAQVVYGNRNWQTHYHGVSPAWFQIKRWPVVEGSVFTDADVEREANVCVIGATVREQLFPAEDPVGKTINIMNIPCQVIGLLAARGATYNGWDQDDIIVTPYTTAMKKFMGQPWLDDIYASAASLNDIKPAGQLAAALLRDRHHLQPGEPDDFNIRNPEDQLQAQVQAGHMFTLFLLCIGSISLLVGGIGIMNVMLVSVTERTREIGVRMAVGATEAAVQFQFLLEAVMLSLVGGAIGVLMGFVASLAVGTSFGWQMQVSTESVLIAALFSTAIGVFFGYYPARKAAQLTPVEALRSE